MAKTKKKKTKTKKKVKPEPTTVELVEQLTTLHSWQVTLLDKLKLKIMKRKL